MGAGLSGKYSIKTRREAPQSFLQGLRPTRLKKSLCLMKRYPELVELESFFNAAASSVYGDGENWFTDRVTFSRATATELVSCTVEPSEGIFSILYSEGGRVLMDVSLRWVVSIDLEHSAGTKLLVGRINQGDVDQLFKLSLVPCFSFRLVTSLPE
jgi:hypothetical protein